MGVTVPVFGCGAGMCVAHQIASVRKQVEMGVNAQLTFLFPARILVRILVHKTVLLIFRMGLPSLSGSENLVSSPLQPVLIATGGVLSSGQPPAGENHPEFHLEKNVISAGSWSLQSSLIWPVGRGL